jgi:hypothetical protein
MEQGSRRTVLVRQPGLHPPVLKFAAVAPALGPDRRPFPVEPVRTLDAVHLATTELLGEPPALVTIVTRDARVGQNTEALGYAVE